MKIKTLLVNMTCALGLALAGSASAQEQGGNFVYLVQPEPPSLASFLSTSGPIGLVAPKIYEGLLDYDNDLNIVPALAESYEVSEDGKTVTFKIREGVTWHDGEPFTSEDVAFSIMEILKKVHPRGPASFAEVTSVDTPDATTAIFNLENPAPYMLRALSGYESPMVPKHLLEGTDPRNSDLATNPVGTGPYVFEEWKKGQYILLTKNENYWKEGLPYLDRVVARFVPDASTRTAAMENGEVMYGAYGAIPNIDAVRLREMDGFSVSTDGYAMINPMALVEFNSTREPFDKPEVRKAISLAIDRNFLIDNIWFGYGNAATSALSSNFSATGLYKAEPEAYPESPDVDAAIALLDEAGVTPGDDGVRLTATLDLIPYGEDWRRAGEYMKQALMPLGIEIELRYEDVPTWLKRVYQDYDFDMTMNYFYQLPDPVLGVHRHYATSQIRQGTHFVNSSQYSNPELDELLAAATTEADADKRAEIYGQVQDILAEDMPVMNLFEMEFLNVFSDKLHGHDASALGAYGSFDQVWIEK